MDADRYITWRSTETLIADERLQSPAKGLREELLPNAAEILQHFLELGNKDRVTGFAEQQVKEETLKAGLDSESFRVETAD